LSFIARSAGTSTEGEPYPEHERDALTPTDRGVLRRQLARSRAPIRHRRGFLLIHAVFFLYRQDDFRCAFAGFFAAASFAVFFPAIGISISFWPGAAFCDFLAGFFWDSVSAAPPPTLRRSASISGRARCRREAIRGDRLAGAFLVDQIDESGFVLVLELVRLEAAGLLLDDVPGEVEQVLGDFDILDVAPCCATRTKSGIRRNISTETKAIQTAEPIASALGVSIEIRKAMHENGALPPAFFRQKNSKS
jgi:hypothetical protein